MKTEYEVMDFTRRIKLEIENIRRKIMEEGYRNVQINFDISEIPRVHVWCQEQPRGFISACHSMKITGETIHDYTVSQYDEKEGEWMEE